MRDHYLGTPAMAREYVALDPKTGKPINVGSGRRKKKKKSTDEGPWMAIPNETVLSLAKGDKDSVRVLSLIHI